MKGERMVSAGSIIREGVSADALRGAWFRDMHKAYPPGPHSYSCAVEPIEPDDVLVLTEPESPLDNYVHDSALPVVCGMEKMLREFEMPQLLFSRPVVIAAKVLQFIILLAACIWIGSVLGRLAQ
jgi:hypothetical protein